jgi:hypothetical protein
MTLKLKSVLGIATVSLAGILSSSASTVSYDFGQVSGGSTPAGTPPWVGAVFSDAGADTVQLTLTAGDLAGGAFVSCWYFNLDPSLSPGSLNFQVTSSTGSFSGPTVQTGANGFKAGPDGKFDVLFSFATAGDDSALFGAGDSVTYTITGITGLAADDFNWLSTSAGGSGAYYSAAHVQPGGGSDISCPAWINPTTISVFSQIDDRPGVPDGASTITLLSASLAGIGALRRKFRSAR